MSDFIKRAKELFGLNQPKDNVKQSSTSENLNTKDGAKAYMLASTSASEWRNRAEHVIALNGGYMPSWWISLITFDNDLVKHKLRLDAEARENGLKR